MEKDNKSVPLRVFSNNFPIDSKSGGGNNATTATSIMQQGGQASAHHPIHSRITDIQMCSNDVIDLASAQARPYELTKINTNLMGIYDVNSSSIANFTEMVPTKSSIVNNLDILKGISKGALLLLRPLFSSIFRVCRLERAFHIISKKCVRSSGISIKFYDKRLLLGVCVCAMRAGNDKVLSLKGRTSLFLAFK
jgi:hypothetical protein